MPKMSSTSFHSYFDSEGTTLFTGNAARDIGGRLERGVAEDIALIQHSRWFKDFGTRTRSNRALGQMLEEREARR